MFWLNALAQGLEPNANIHLNIPTTIALETDSLRAILIAEGLRRAVDGADIILTMGASHQSHLALEVQKTANYLQLKMQPFSQDVLYASHRLNPYIKIVREHWKLLEPKAAELKLKEQPLVAACPKCSNSELDLRILSTLPDEIGYQCPIENCGAQGHLPLYTGKVRLSPALENWAYWQLLGVNIALVPSTNIEALRQFYLFWQQLQPDSVWPRICFIHQNGKIVSENIETILNLFQPSLWMFWALRQKPTLPSLLFDLPSSLRVWDEWENIHKIPDKYDEILALCERKDTLPLYIDPPLRLLLQLIEVPRERLLHEFNADIPAPLLRQTAQEKIITAQKWVRIFKLQNQWRVASMRPRRDFKSYEIKLYELLARSVPTIYPWSGIKIEEEIGKAATQLKIPHALARVALQKLFLAQEEFFPDLPSGYILATCQQTWALQRLHEGSKLII